MEMYFIAIVLPEELNKKILKYKNMMQEKFNCRVGLKSPAHITIIPPFWLNEELQDQLIADIELLSKEIEPFSISTNNMSAFKPRTIFIDICINLLLQDVKQKAEILFSKREVYRFKPDKRPFHPHITIATRDLTKKSFHEAWELLEHLTFKEEWLSNSISLLKHNKKNWDVFHTSQFKN